jgi:5-formyltetrahydrofolate cyclo-ligase
MLKARNSLSKEVLISMSEMIQARVLQTDEFIGAKTIGAYHPIGSEAGTMKIITSALRMKKRVALPRVVNDSSMVFAEVNDIANDLRIGRYKIMEPKDRCPKVDNLDMLLLPGVAWDAEGYRLGYGKGYYDRYLSGSGAKRIGLAYELQVLEKIPHGSDDLRVDLIITEKRVIRPRR